MEETSQVSKYYENSNIWPKTKRFSHKHEILYDKYFEIKTRKSVSCSLYWQGTVVDWEVFPSEYAKTLLF